MNEDQDDESDNQGDEPHWWQRPTVARLKRDAEAEAREFGGAFDRDDNERTRLPESESVHLGGLVLTEAFTPQVVSELYRRLERWPSNRPERRREMLDRLARSRAGGAGGWQSLGMVRRPGAFIMGDGHHDGDLPAGVDAVWLQLNYLTPSLAVVVATFSLADEAAELSPLLRRDYERRHYDIRLKVYGRLGRIRAAIPWARPARHGVGYSVSHPSDEKRRACEAQMRDLEATCEEWFYTTFRGRFAMAEASDRPIGRIILTREHEPYRRTHASLGPAGLASAFPAWRGHDLPGWWLDDRRWRNRDERPRFTLAARRGDVRQDKDTNDDSNWSLTQRLGRDGASLAALLAIPSLLDLYADRLAGLRDEAGSKGFPRRTVAEARNLEDYLLRDGLDAATLTPDLEVLTEKLTRFRWGVLEFVEDLSQSAEAAPKRKPQVYVQALCEEIRGQARRLAADTATTTSGVRASAELRQAIADTRLQRLTLVISLVATVIAVVSVMVAKS